MAQTQSNSEQTLVSWLLEVTGLPTAAGHEDHVVAWVMSWAHSRPHYEVCADKWGNLIVGARGALESSKAERAPVVIVAHMDHPAFVVEAIDEDSGTLDLTFRGGVRPEFFLGSALTVHTGSPGEEPATYRAVVTEYDKDAKPFQTAKAELKGDVPKAAVSAGDIARWELPDPSVDTSFSGRGLLRTHATDNLTSVVAALAMMDELKGTEAESSTALLLTRGEEVGFAGALGAVETGTLPKDARIVVLENSKSFADSPIGGGVIVRVGDRSTVFNTQLTLALDKCALAIEKEESEAQEDSKPEHPFIWQRKLMQGGACEATVFNAYGYATACLCLPLGSYHNMANADEVASEGSKAVLGQEHVALDDFFSMVQLLVRFAKDVDTVPQMHERLEELWKERESVVQRQIPGSPQAITAD